MGYVPVTDIAGADSAINDLYGRTDAVLHTLANVTLPKLGGLPLAGGVMTGEITAYMPGGTWISGMTHGAIIADKQMVSSQYFPFFRQKSQSNHVVTLGGLGDRWGFYGYDAARAQNGTDYSFVMNLATGNMEFTGGSIIANGTAVSLSGHMHSYLPLAGGTIIGNVALQPATGERYYGLNVGPMDVRLTASEYGFYIYDYTNGVPILNYSPGGEIFMLDQPVWHAGNFNPANHVIQTGFYLDGSASGCGTMLAGSTVTGSIRSVNNSTTSSIGFPNIYGRSWTFDGGMPGRTFSLWKRSAGDRRLYFQDYDATTGAGMGWSEFWSSANLTITGWQQSTPTLGGVTLGNGTLSLYTCELNGVVFFVFDLSFGSTSAVTGAVTFTLPSAALHKNDFYADLWDGGSNRYLGHASLSGSTVSLYASKTSLTTGWTADSNIDATTPFTWAASDRITVSGFYRKV